MDNCKLRQDEVVLLKAAVKTEGKEDERELMLTNLRILICAAKEHEQDDRPVDAYELQDIKLYRDKPYLEQKGGKVTVYLTGEEVTVDFGSMFTAKKFREKIMDIFTDKNFVLRGVDKVKSAIGVVDDTLGIDSAGMVGSIIKNGVLGTLFHGSKQDGKKSEKQEDKTVEELEKYKKLFDDGVITEEEFAAKKKQILGL